MKLYYSKGACSLAVRITLNELGLLFDSESVDLRAKKTEKGHDFYKINPKGSVPVLLLDDGTVMTENAVIQQYLAEAYRSYQLLPEIGDSQRYQVLTWVNYVSTELHKGGGLLFSPNLSEEVKDAVFRPIVRARLDFVAKQLQHTQAYLAGEHFTIADSYLFTVLGWLRPWNIDIAAWPVLSDYIAKLQTRPAVKLALTQEELL